MGLTVTSQIEKPRGTLPHPKKRVTEQVSVAKGAFAYILGDSA